MLKRLTIIAAGLAVTVFCCSAAFAQAPRATSAESANRKTRPGVLVLDGVDNNDYSLIREIDLEGLKKILQRDPKDTRPLLLNFWATWCDGCREEFPDMVKINNEYKGKGLNFVAVSLDDLADVNGKVLPFLKEMKATMSQVLLNVKDPEPAIHTVDPTWQGDMPATFLYDKDGKVVFKFFGRIKPDELRAAIDKAIGAK